MSKEIFTFTGHNDMLLNAYIWCPDTEPVALLQITHGMTEHMGRYQNFAEKMNAGGVVVAGFDLRGHGQNPGEKDCATFGQDGWNATLEDMKLFSDLLRRRFSCLPHFMLGFSLGSFLLREYLGIYPEGISGAVIAGTGQQPPLLLNIMSGIVRGQIRKAGFDKTTDLVKKLSFGVYNDKFKPTRTESDWLCSDTKQVNRYRSDKLCRKNISSGLFLQLMQSMKKTAKVSSYSGWNKEMPVLLLSGDCDPVGNMGKGLQVVASTMKLAGLQNVSGYLLPGARHDIFHELSSGIFDSAVSEILKWMLD